VTSLIWSDGAARTPPVLFTYDPKFRNRKISTDRRKAIRSQVDALFEKYSIASFKVFWLGESSCYVPESMELLGFYGAMVDVPPNSVIFHNRGNAFMSQGDSVVPQVFSVKAAVYLPIVHQFFSPNDNRFHGTAKESGNLWLQKRVGVRMTQLSQAWHSYHFLHTTIPKL